MVERSVAKRAPRAGGWRPPGIALLVAGTALIGLATTLRATTPPPLPTAPPIRYDSGAPFAPRLIVIFAPRLDDRGLTALGGAVRPDPTGRVAHFTTARPAYSSFAEISLQILAGTTSSGDPVAPPGQPVDTLVNAVHDRGQGVTLSGPAQWQALFNLGPAPAGAATPVAARLIAAGLTLRDAPDKLLVLYLPEVTGRDVNGALRADLARFGGGVSNQDAVLMVGGGGGLGAPLAVTLSGPGIAETPSMELPFNDLAPTCAVLLGAPFPYETRGQIAWSLLETDSQVKAIATAALARQRTTLAARAVPFGASPTPLLQATIAGLPTIDAVAKRGDYDYAYQLAASAVKNADQSLDQSAAAPLYLPARRAAWPLVALAVTLALLAPLVAFARRQASALVLAIVGFLLGLAAWLTLVTLLRGAVAPALPIVALILVPPVLLGSRVATLASWSRRGRRRRKNQRAARNGEFLVLLAALPAAYCALRYGYPWRLRADEVVLRARWQSALLAPALLVLASYAWVYWFPVQRKRAAAADRPGVEPHGDADASSRSAR